MVKAGESNLADQAKKYAELAHRILSRWWIIAIFTVVGIAGSVTFALLATRIYESRTLIAWKQGMNRRLSQGDDEGLRREEGWLNSLLEQMLSSHTELWKLANDFNIYPERKVLQPEVILEMIRKAIKFDTVGTDTFWIAFEYKDPYKAQKVTAHLAREFIQKNVTEKLKAALTTQTFMENEVAKAKSQMDEIENDLASFTAEHPEFQLDPTRVLIRSANPSRPAESKSNFAGVKNPELQKALARKGKLEAQLQLLLNPQADTKLTQAKQDLIAAQRSLSNKRRQYTDQHPDVLRAIQAVQYLQLQLQYAKESSAPSSTALERLKEDIAEVDQTIARLTKTQRKITDSPTADKTDNSDSVKDTEEVRTEGQKKKLNAKANLEKRWYQITRDREIAKAKLDQLQERSMRAKVAANLEKKQAEIQFVIVDPANLSFKPVRPNRTKPVLSGTLLGIMIGFALAGLLTIFDPHIYNEDDLQKICDLPVLAQIPKEV